jgi:hypothetical protein
LLFEALLVVDLWGDDQEQADQERDQQPGQPFPDEAGRGPRAERVPGAQAGHHKQQRHSPQPGEQHEQRQRQVGRLVLHIEVQRVKDAGGVEEDQPAHDRRPHQVQVLSARASRCRHGRAHRRSLVQEPPRRTASGGSILRCIGTTVGLTNVELWLQSWEVTPMTGDRLARAAAIRRCLLMAQVAPRAVAKHAAHLVHRDLVPRELDQHQVAPALA